MRIKIMIDLGTYGIAENGVKTKLLRNPKRCDQCRMLMILLKIRWGIRGEEGEGGRKCERLGEAMSFGALFPLLQTVATLAVEILISHALTRLVPGASVGEIVLEPSEDKLSQFTVAGVAV